MVRGDLDSALVAVIRSPLELAARVSRRAESGGVGYQLVSIPLNELGPWAGESQQRVRGSWEALRLVERADAQTLYHIAILLLETVPDLRSQPACGSLPPEWTTPPQPVRATAANPRAFRGTKHQPPKVSRSPRLDVRGYLCDARMLKMLVEPLLRFWPQVRSWLLSAGYVESALNAVQQEMTGQNSRKGVWTLPRAFVINVWPLIRQVTGRASSRLFSFFAESEMEADERLLAAFTRLILEAGAVTAAEWADVARRLPRRLQSPFLEQLVETGALASLRADEVCSHVEQVAFLASEEMFPKWCARFLQAAAHEGRPDFLLAGFRLAARFSPQYRFEEIGRCDAFPEDTVAEIAESGAQPWLAMRLWQACFQLPGLAEVIRRAAWREMTEAARWRYTNFLIGFGDQGLSRRRLENKWRAVMAELPRIEALVLATPPEYQRKVVDYLEEWLWFWDEPVFIRRRLRLALDLLPRLARAPLEVGSNAAAAVGWLVELSTDDLWSRVLDAPVDSWLAVERACSRTNASRFIARGFSSMMRGRPAFMLDALYGEPVKLATTAEALGGLAYDARKQILEECNVHPLFVTDPLQGPFRENCDLIRRHVPEPSANPIPAKLRDWLDGKCTLRDGQLSRCRQLVAQRLTRARLGWIQWAVMERLKRGLPAAETTASVRHALRLLGAVDENRRALRKFLKAYFSGSRNYIALHPETTAWYRTHPRIPRETWENGVAFPGAHVGGRFVSLSIETDPLEVLKMGTYVGTCLGLGGSFSYSAVAVLLDANKRVIYARDQRGTVVARQLVAVSTQETLVCFYVYPESAGAEVKRLFRDYDEALSQALSLPLHRHSEVEAAPYEIESVIAKQWWDDMAWDLAVEDSEED